MSAFDGSQPHQEERLDTMAVYFARVLPRPNDYSASVVAVAKESGQVGVGLGES